MTCVWCDGTGYVVTGVMCKTCGGGGSIMTKEELTKLCAITAEHNDWILSVNLIEASDHEAHCKEYQVNQSGKWPASVNHVMSAAFEPFDAVLCVEDMMLDTHAAGCSVVTQEALVVKLYASALSKKAEIKAARNPAMGQSAWSDCWEAMERLDQLIEATRGEVVTETKGAA